MNADPKRPIIVLLTSHWISMLGVALVTTAGVSWLFVLPITYREPEKKVRLNAANAICFLEQIVSRLSLEAGVSGVRSRAAS